jgi:hypothetical protein
VVSKTLTLLRLQSCSIGPKGCVQLSEGVRRSSSLSELYLCWNTIGHDGSRGLGSALACSSSLTSLILQGCSIVWDGHGGPGRTLSEGVGRSASLTKLDLCWNKIGEDGARGLGAALAVSSTLKSLRLEECSIGGAGCWALSEGVGRSVSLTVLDLGGNKFGLDGARGLGAALAVSSTLKSLRMEECNICEQGCCALADGVRCGPRRADPLRVIGLDFTSVAHKLVGVGACPAGGWTNELLLTAFNEGCSLGCGAADNGQAQRGGVQGEPPPPSVQAAAQEVELGDLSDSKLPEATHAAKVNPKGQPHRGDASAGRELEDMGHALKDLRSQLLCKDQQLVSLKAENQKLKTEKSEISETLSAENQTLKTELGSTRQKALKKTELMEQMKIEMRAKDSENQALKTELDNIKQMVLNTTECMEQMKIGMRRKDSEIARLRCEAYGVEVHDVDRGETRVVELAGSEPALKRMRREQVAVQARLVEVKKEKVEQERRSEMRAAVDTKVQAALNETLVQVAEAMECACCFEPLAPGSAVAFNCGHTYCNGALCASSSSALCPECRQVVTARVPLFGALSNVSNALHAHSLHMGTTPTPN